MDLFESLGLGPKPPDDNTVFFELYPSLDQPTSEQGESELLALRARCMQHARPLLKDYIWQKEAFELKTNSHELQPWAKVQPSKKRRGGFEAHPPLGRPAQSSSTAGGSDPPPCLPCLWGCLCWGENIEDEWFVVHLLLEMTKHIDGLAARVWDNDGEFLLIEAAYALPKWLKPESAANRVWLKGGCLHIVPLPSSKHPALPPAPSILQALQIMASKSVPTVAPKGHAAIAARLEGYPGKALQAGCHRSMATLPTRLAAALKTHPQLVSAAVDAFYFRDGDDMKAAARMRHFPPSEPRTTILITTNRCQYAQLAQQSFAPPRGWRLPPPNHPDLPRAERGLKITAGFEILMARSARVSKVATAPAPEAPRQQQQQQQQQLEQQGLAAGAPMEPAAAAAAAALSGGAVGGPAGAQQAAVTEAQLQCLPTWGPYKGSLERMGYFQGQLPGSCRYKELMAAAIDDFVASPIFVEGTAAALGPAEVLQQLLAQGPSAVEAEGQHFACEGVEDSDSWMDAQGEVVELELAKRQSEMEAGPLGRAEKAGKKKGARSAVHGEDATTIDAVEVAERIRGFVEALSGLEGAELPASDLGVSFNPKMFARELEQVIGVPFGGPPGATGGGKVEEEEEEEEDWEESTEEGSSFFSDDDDEDGLDTEVEEEEEEEEEEDKEAAQRAGARGGAGAEGRGGAALVADSACPEWSGVAGAVGLQGRSGQEGALRGDQREAQGALGGNDKGRGGGGSSSCAGDGSEAGAGCYMQPAGPGRSSRVHRRADGRGQPGPQCPPLPPRLQRLQDLWEVRTATDSDDDADADCGGGGDAQQRRRRQREGDSEDEEDALSIGGHSRSGSSSSSSSSSCREGGRGSGGRGSRGGGRRGQAAGGVGEGSGSDGEDGFMDAYAAELEAQLRGTTLDASFERGGGPHTETCSNTATHRGAAAATGQQHGGASGEADALQPVDLDLNLVRNLVKSVASQQGFAGPGTNLASLLGLELPQSLDAGGDT